VLLLNRYLAKEIGGVLIVAAPAICLLVALLQGMRLAPVVAGADIAGLEAARLIGLLLVPLVSAVLPAAAVISLLVAFGRLAGDGELVALRASGVGSGGLAAAPVVVCAAVALTSGAVSIFGEPGAYTAMHRRLGELLSRAAMSRVRPGVICEPTEAITVWSQARRGNRLKGVFIEDRHSDPPVQLFAAAASFGPLAGHPAVRLVLEDGELQARAPDGTLTRATFSRLETVVELEGASRSLASLVPRHLGRSPWQLIDDARSDAPGARTAALVLHRRLSVAPGTVGLCVLTLLLVLWRPVPGRPLAIVLGALLLLGYHLLVRTGEAAAESGLVSPVAGGWLAAGASWLAVGSCVFISRVRRGPRDRYACDSP
jgi:lipopolysaccharide export LptBFGC system permease protein LptF